MAGSGSNPNPAGDRTSGSPSRSEKPAAKDSRHILIVEDDSADVFLISEAIHNANSDVELEVVNDGDKAIRFFEKVDGDDSLACPALVILDINLPKKHGGQVLQQMRKTRRCSSALVLVVTSSDSARDRETMAKLGANGYFRKPSDYEHFMQLGGLVKELLDHKPGCTHH
jgi:chemotaxis family two-component system response regulator Rcp1